MADTTDLALDDETTAALTLFNEYLAADRERQQRERRIAKAEKAKDEAAATLRALESRGVTGERRAEAEAAYREALETWKTLRDGGEPEPTDRPDDAPTDQADDAPTDRPDDAPTDRPDDAPTDRPDDAPTDQADDAPTDQADDAPTDQGTG